MTYEESLKAQSSLMKRIRKDMEKLDDDARQKIAAWFVSEFAPKVEHRK